MLLQWVLNPWCLDLSLQVQHYRFWTNLAFAYKTKTLGCLYSHVLLIPTK